MSYSFSVRGATKAEVLVKVRDELVKVVAAQANHKDDCDQAHEVAELFVNLLADDPDRDVVVSVNGSLGWTLDADQKPRYSNASVGVQAYLTTRE